MVYGSLHFITFDGRTYSFKALGEFVILRLSSATGSNIFTLQGQIDRLHPDANRITEVPAVVRMAAFYQGIGKLVHASKNNFAVRCTELQRCTAVYANGLHVVVWRSGGSNQLCALVEVPEAFFNRTVGLMGLWSANPSDDFLMSDGKAIRSTNVSTPAEEKLHLFGLSPGPESLLSSLTPMNSLVVTPTEDLLKSITPAEIEELTRTCKSSMQCVHDTLATGVPELGQETLKAETEFQNLALIKNMPPIVTQPTVIRSQVKSQVSVQIIAEDANRDNITYSLLLPRPPQASINSNGYLTWTPLSTQPVQLSIKVSDKLGSSLFTPILRVCNCLNGGTCQYDSITENHLQGKFQVVGCLCPTGFSGKFCENTTDLCQGEPCFRGVQCRSESGQFTCGECPDNTFANGKKGYKCFESMCIPPFPFPCHKYAYCNSTKQSYTCTCMEGFNGDGHNCTKDECVEILTCQNAKYECKNKLGTYECICRYKNSKDDEGCYNMFNVSVTWKKNAAGGIQQLDDMLTKGFTNKYYNITEINQEFTPDVHEYRIKVSSDTPHWYITDYLTRVSSHFGIHAIEVNIPHLYPNYIPEQYNPPPFNYSDPALQYITHCSPRILDNYVPRQRHR
uniref:Si:ch73-105b23.6 n=1 Tax=Neolamprologus brichardi TaxID=32507 RepID=A0A3Q4HTD6_NEOBR